MRVFPISLFFISSLISLLFLSHSIPASFDALDLHTHTHAQHTPQRPSFSSSLFGLLHSIPLLPLALTFLKIKRTNGQFKFVGPYFLIFFLRARVLPAIRSICPSNEQTLLCYIKTSRPKFSLTNFFRSQFQTCTPMLESCLIHKDQLPARKIEACALFEIWSQLRGRINFFCRHIHAKVVVAWVFGRVGKEDLKCDETTFASLVSSFSFHR